MTHELIDKFKEKQGFKTAKKVDDETWAFDGFFFSSSDIEYDMTAEIPAGKIKLYAVEGTENGSMPSYPVWIATWFGL